LQPARRRGSFCLQRLALEERAAEAAAGPPRVTASAVLGSNAAALALDGRADTGGVRRWRAGVADRFRRTREFNGVKLRWLRGETCGRLRRRHLRRWAPVVDASARARRRRQPRRAVLPESETRYLR